jgi:hypothetical protein
MYVRNVPYLIPRYVEINVATCASARSSAVATIKIPAIGPMARGGHVGHRRMERVILSPQVLSE